MDNPSISMRLVQVPTLLAVLLMTTAMLFLLGSSEVMAHQCKIVHGRFIDQALVPPPECTSPIGVCVSGEAIGGLRGDFFATVTSITPSIDTPVTAVVFETADTVLHTEGGDLEMKEAAASNTNPDEGDLGDVITIVGGTGKWVGATGHLRVWGKLSVAISEVRYEGEVCRP